MEQFTAQVVGYSRALDLLRRIHSVPMSSFCCKESGESCIQWVNMSSGLVPQCEFLLQVLQSLAIMCL